MRIYCVLVVVLLFNQQPCVADIHFLHRHWVATQGTSFPKNIDIVRVDDIVVYYYISGLKETSMPKWLNHPDGILLWKEMQDNILYNRHILDTAVIRTSERFNHSHDHIYQVHGKCELNTENDEHVSAVMSHAYDGKDFVGFDVTSKTWSAAVSEAVFYKNLRQNNGEDLHRLSYRYEKGCFDWLKKLLNFSEGERKEKVPGVVLFEKFFLGTSEKMVTCHVTGFYPRRVRVEWLNEEGHMLVDGVNSAEVLPNGDGTYQLRQILTVPDEAQWYSCVVVHSSVTGNITLVWKSQRMYFMSAVIGCLFFVVAAAVVAVLIWKLCRNRNQGL